MSFYLLNKKNYLGIILCLVLGLFSLSCEARFGGGGGGSSSSHSSFHSSNSSGGFVPGLVIFFGYMGISAIRGYYRKKTTDTRQPEDINEESFVKFLKERFMLMQKLWDNDDWNQIALYVVPSMMPFLKKRRQETKKLQAPITVIEKLSVEIISYETRKRNQTIVTVNFSGSDNHAFFYEQWQLKRKGGAEASWRLIKLKQL